MRIGNDFADRATIPYGVATCLVPVENLDASLVQNRDAYRLLAERDTQSVVVVTPESTASGYLLAQHPLTLLAIKTLPATHRREIAGALDESVDAYTHIQLGRTIESGRNHSLSEFGAAPELI